jgi:hypothetical protein
MEGFKQQAEMVLASPIIEVIDCFAINSRDFDEGHASTLVWNSSLTDHFTLSWY